MIKTIPLFTCFMSVNLHVASGYKAEYIQHHSPLFTNGISAGLFFCISGRKVMCYLNHSHTENLQYLYSTEYLLHLHGVDVCLVHRVRSLSSRQCHLCDDSHTHQSSNPGSLISTPPPTSSIVNENKRQSGCLVSPPEARSQR